MADKPTYKEMERRVNELEKEVSGLRRVGGVPELEGDKLQYLMGGLAHAEIGIDIVGIDYAVLYENEFLKERFGKFTGRLCYEKYMGLEEPCDFCPMIKAVKNNKVESLELSGHDGRNYEVRSVPFPNPDGTVDKAIEVIRDITDRKQAEKELRESEERYRAFFENAADMITVIDTEGILVDVNKKFEEESLYKREEMIGKNAFSSGIMTESSAKLTTQYLQRFLAGEPWSIFEIDGLRKDGKVMPYEIRAVPIKKNGAVIGVQAILRNIADRRRAEEALQKSEEKYRSILENMEEGYYEVDLAGNSTFCNDSLCKIFGYSRDEMLGKNNRELSTPETAARIYGLYNRVYETGQSMNFIDYEVIAKDGSTVILEGSASLMSDNSGQSIGFCGLFRDVTEHKKAEEALRESEEQYRKLYDSVSDFIFTHDADGRFITVNRATTEYLGYTADELIGRPLSDFMLPEYRESFHVEYLPEIKKKGFYEGVSVYLDRRGEKLYVEYRNTLVEREGKEPYATGVGRDITERVKSQKEMGRLERQVQHAQRMEAIGTLAGGIAHNFNNLLMGIQGYTSLMLLDTDPDHPFHE